MPINYINIANGIVGFTQKHYETAQHSHFYVEVAFALSGSLCIRAKGKVYKQVKSIIINSNKPHSFDCLDGACQLYFFNPTDLIGHQLLKEYLPGQKEILVDHLPSLEFFLKYYLPENNKQEFVESNIEARIGLCLKWIERNYLTEDINIAKVSEVALLSDSRLAHLFKEQIGISVHQYILWKKMEEAILLSQKGFSLTNCAHSLGFTDSSHFNRTFKKMFGTSPYFALKK